MFNNDKLSTFTVKIIEFRKEMSKMRRSDREVKDFADIVRIMEKYDALCVLMQHYHQETFPFNKSVIPHTTVFKLIVESMAGKIRMKKI